MVRTGIRMTELALHEVGAVFYPSGAIRPEVYVSRDNQGMQGAQNLPDSAQVPHLHRAMDGRAFAARLA